ncbi:MAG: ABC transporter ATP-binding protein [Pirellulaceae bacterium]
MDKLVHRLAVTHAVRSSLEPRRTAQLISLGSQHRALDGRHMMKVAIESSQLTKVYGGLFKRGSFKALDSVSLSLPQGRIFGLLGPNGAGKTTFIKILLGIIRKTGGEATVLGQPAGSVECRRLIGYLPEQMRIPRHLTGLGAMSFYGSLSGMNRKDIAERAPMLLEKVGLQGREKELTRRYSKGMVQRVGLAQALLHQPEVLILDEPTDGLDPRARREMRELLLRLREEEGVTIFLNSHILQEVEMVCDDVAIMHQGRLRYSGPVADVNSFFNAGKSDSVWQARLRVLGPSSMIASVFEGIGKVDWETARSTDGSTSTPDSIDAEEVVPLASAIDEDVPIALSTNDSPDSHATEMEVDIHAEFPSQVELDACIDRLRAARLSLVGLARERVTLEDAFMQLTGGEEVSQ